MIGAFSLLCIRPAPNTSKKQFAFESVTLFVRAGGEMETGGHTVTLHQVHGHEHDKLLRAHGKARKTATRTFELILKSLQIFMVLFTDATTWKTIIPKQMHM